jgi:hypothetical protein
MMTSWHLSTTMIARDDDIDVPMCLARADEVALRRGFKCFRGDTSASSRLALLVSSYVFKSAESC